MPFNAGEFSNESRIPMAKALSFDGRCRLTDSDRVTISPSSGDDRHIRGSHRLEPLDDQGFSKAVAGPFLECGERRHRIDIVLRVTFHLDRISAKAMHDGRKHRVRAAEGAEQERPLFSVTLMALGP